MAVNSEITREDIYKVLFAKDVNAHVEKKGNLTFLSWTWAVGYLMETFPNSTYYFKDDKVFADGSMEVSVILAIEGHEYLMWLPVMDNRHNAIPTPSATDINKARMRCLTKAIAMAGLGFSVYSGEDLPQTENDAYNPVIPDQKAPRPNYDDIGDDFVPFKKGPKAGLKMNQLGVKDLDWIVEESSMNQKVKDLASSMIEQMNVNQESDALPF